MIVLATSGAFLQGRSADSAPNQAGYVYAMSNLPTGNTIMVFSRSETGTLTKSGEFETGGLGFITGQPDPLASQGSLILHGQHLFAVNAGSDSISALRVQGAGLKLVSRISSGGTLPTGLTAHRNLLYVQNAGSGEITAFQIGENGELAELEGSTRSLSGGPTADPAQISFTPDGRFLLVTQKTPSLIDVFTLDESGRAGDPAAVTSNGLTPFGFAFGTLGRVLISEAFGGLPNAGAVSSYLIGNEGALNVVSGSVPDSQTAACWLVITNDGKHAYVTNTGSGSISSYRMNSEGTLELLRSVAALTTPGGAPLDMALDTKGRFLYALVNTTGTISAFRVIDDGSLVPIRGADTLPPFAQGIAAN